MEQAYFIVSGVIDNIYYIIVLKEKIKGGESMKKRNEKKSIKKVKFQGSTCSACNGWGDGTSPHTCSSCSACNGVISAHVHSCGRSNYF